MARLFALSRDHLDSSHPTSCLEDHVRSFRKWAIETMPLRFQVPARYWYRRVRHRLEQELPIVTKLLPNSGTAIDIGANVGVYTYALSRLGLRVEAFEPLPTCARAIGAYRSKSVRVHEVALSSRSGEREIFVPRDSNVMRTALASFSRPSGVCETVRVSVRQLDEYAFSDVVFIKIDVEGHELEVLRGASATIAKSHPLLLVEIEQRHLAFPMENVFAELSAYGYAGFFLYESRMHELSEFSYKRHQEPFLDNVSGGTYANNFIFLHEQSLHYRHPNW